MAYFLFHLVSQVPTSIHLRLHQTFGLRVFLLFLHPAGRQGEEDSSEDGWRGFQSWNWNRGAWTKKREDTDTGGLSASHCRTHQPEGQSVWKQQHLGRVKTRQLSEWHACCCLLFVAGCQHWLSILVDNVKFPSQIKK